ncbi:alkaline phosphatase PhoX [Jatrophihabitans fulvus]
MAVSRRQILTGGAAGVGLAVAGTIPALSSDALAAPAPQGKAPKPPKPPKPQRDNPPFPPLQADPDGLLALPAGFSYRIVTETGKTELDGGGKTPGAHDGTHAFAASKGRTRLVQNHELTSYGNEFGVPHVRGTVYDRGADNAGGCTVIEVDRDGRNLGEWVGISGTLTNCAGGHTPWGSWLTCEETETKAGTTWTKGDRSGTYQKDHGYVFEVFAEASTRQLPKPIKAFGRYAHEALAVSPDRTRVYLSEDASGPNGLFYRWTAPKGVKLGAGIANQLGPKAGVLEAMKIVLDDGSVLPDVAYITSAQLGRPFKVEWVEVPDRDAASVSVRKQFTDGQVTRGKKFEGVFGTDHGAYVVNSFAFGAADLPADAVKHDGLVWFYDYKAETIKLVTYFPHQAQAEGSVTPKYSDMTFDGPDNVTVTPWGSLVLAEDGVGASHVLSSVPNGPTYAIARNELNDSEFTGPTFSPDGRTLFVNMQTPGYTFAITGPWEKYLG